MKTFLLIFGVFIILLIIVVFFINNSVYAPTEVTPDPVQSIGVKHDISFTETGFVPIDLIIKRGDSVVFINESENNFWPASDDHPTHGKYPIGGGCIGSSFDACAEVLPGGIYSFTFTEEGSWTYHDHIDPDIKGQITVNE